MARPALSDSIPVRIPLDVLADIDTIAVASNRSRSWVVLRALRLCLAGEGVEILNVVNGLKQIEDGDSYDMDDVVREIEQIVRGKGSSFRFGESLRQAGGDLPEKSERARSRKVSRTDQDRAV